MSDIWPLEKRQLLIDSIINDFDIPKFYFHEFHPPKKYGRTEFDFAIIDGKQRLSSIRDFIENKFPLSETIEYMAEPSFDIRNLTYKELSLKYPYIRDVFNSFPLDIVTIVTDDIELIEDMFSRLNEAIPLNAAEKRNAWGGAIPPAVKRIAGHDFFKKNIPFKNARYRYLELATKFMFLSYTIAETADIADTKKKHLDEFVKAFKVKQGKAQGEKNRISAEHEKNCEKILYMMNKVFSDSDKLLRSIGMVILYFILFLKIVDPVMQGTIKRKQLYDFQKQRENNRKKAEEDLPNVSYDLIEFDRLTQSPNDKSALVFRLKIIEDYIKSK